MQQFNDVAESLKSKLKQSLYGEKKMKKTIILSALILIAGNAFAQDEENTLAMLDTDIDGRISVEEAASDVELSAVFAELDVDKDGYLTPSELAEY